MTGIIEFRARRPGTDTIDTDLYDVTPLRDAFERFASGVTLRFRDPDQTKIDDYPFGTRVEVQTNTDATTGQFDGVFVAGFGESQAGFGISDVVTLSSNRSWWARGTYLTLEPSRTTSDGFPIVEVDAVGYEHLLTREQIVKDYSSSAKTTILNDIITTFTPITWDANQVDVQDDTSIDLSLRGVTPAEAISEIVSRSANEEWGVDDELTFFLESQNTSSAPDVADTDVIDHDLPERGARDVNKFTVYYGASEDKAWVEEDRQAQLDLKDQLNADRRVVIADSDSFPEITTEDEAREKAKKRLDDQSLVKTGTITTPLGSLRTRSGDVFDLSISDAGISNEEFRIAQIDYEWGRGITRRTIAKNTAANIDELLISLSESLTNERLQTTATNPTEVKALRLESELEVTPTAKLQTKTAASDSFVLGQSDLGLNTSDELGGGLDSASTSVSIDSSIATKALLDLLRDLWKTGNSAFTDLTHVSVGTGSSTPSISDDKLAIETGRVNTGRFGETGTVTVAEISVAVPAGGAIADSGAISEIGAQDAASGGSLYARFVTSNSVSIDSDTRLTGRITIALDNDSAGDGVVTNTGQERWLDLLVGTSGVEPTDFVYGDGTSAESVSDTSLDNQIHEDAIDNDDIGSTGIMHFFERVKTSDAATEDIAELGLENSSDELLSRFQFEAYGESVEIETIYGFRANNV